MEKTFNPKPYLTETHKADIQSSGFNPEQIAATSHFSADKATADKLIGVKAARINLSLLRH